MEERQGSPRRVRSSSISSMSQLLLQGWAMLADCCPDCGVPLMRSPDGTQLLCTNCGRDTAASAAAAESGGPTEAPAATPQPEQANGTGGHADSSRDGEASEGLLQPLPPLRSRLQAAAAAEGAAPQPASQPAASTLQQLPVPAPGLAVRTAASARGERPGSGGQEASKAIAELMLEGWAMLQDHCPRCLNPLLRSRDRQRIYCAGCRLDAVREGEQPVAASAPPAAASPVLPAAERAAAQPPAMTAVAAGTAPTGTAAGALQQHAATVDAAALAVAARLSAATAALPAAAADRAAQLLSEVRLCAAALQALAEAHAALGAHHTTL